MMGLRFEKVLLIHFSSFGNSLFNINFIEKSCLKRLLPTNQHFLENLVFKTFCSRMTIFEMKRFKIIGLSKEFLSLLVFFGNPIFNINFIGKSCFKCLLPTNQHFLENHAFKAFCSRMTIFEMKTFKIIGLSKELLSILALFGNPFFNINFIEKNSKLFETRFAHE